MKNYIVLFREPDGRLDDHTEEEISVHRKNWTTWLNKWGSAGNLAGGNSLTLEGRLITGDGTVITKGMHQVGEEIVGGFLLLKADDLDQATQIAASCPIYELGGYAEVRELQNQ
ncbi:YciI family protein [Mucilaginibacter sabulilitoris]|uniref:YciI family protein n=1 Tax=Mucilaginibacter sabulilitoris TaxID=1173583 RepID=A0ABZ0TTH3_9SPHI|nr:YciI family protein [Mucilaginibacter sabulilitoris]WPU96286.1 YciI family protein [Mucilaginibacter sabulilitoris]